ncbi:MAG: Ig-like domain-containing protein [Lachnospiraceae bacterium]|nr:Ig-like domain-containing protein [Lachnospiraceae bacterium]
MKKILKSMISVFVFALLIAGISTCNVKEAEAKAASLSKKSLIISVKETSKLKVKNAGGKSVTWSSNKKKVAKVSNGKVTGVKKGSAVITAKVGSKKLKCKVTVESPKLNTSFITLQGGNTYTLKLSSKRKVKWTSNNKKIATVSSKGVVKAIAKGYATITAKVGNMRYNCYVTVPDIDVAAKITESHAVLSGTDRVLVVLNNPTKYHVHSCTATVSFYQSGKLVAMKDVSSCDINGNSSFATYASIPYDANHKKITFDSVSVKINSAPVNEYYSDLKNSSKYSLTTQTLADGIHYTITDVGTKKASAYVGCVFYNGSTPVAYSWGFNYAQPGKTVTNKISFPSVPYTSVKIYTSFYSFNL